MKNVSKFRKKEYSLTKSNWKSIFSFERVLLNDFPLDKAWFTLFSYNSKEIYAANGGHLSSLISNAENRVISVVSWTEYKYNLYSLNNKRNYVNERHLKWVLKIGFVPKFKSSCCLSQNVMYSVCNVYLSCAKKYYI